MDFFLYQVHRRWYHFYWGVMVGFNLLFAGIIAAAHLTTGFESYLLLFAVNNTAIVVTGITLLYLVSGFWFVARSSLPFATLIGSMLFTIVLLNGLAFSNPGRGALLYVLAWLVTVFFAGVYGLPVLVGSVFLTLVYVAFQSDFQVGLVSRPSALLMIGSTLLAVLVYFFWKNRFMSLETQKLNQLSGMLQSNQQQSEILIQSITDGIIVIDTTSKITHMNPAAATMTQWTVGEAVGVDAKLVVNMNNEDGSEIIKEQDPFALVFKQKKSIKQVVQLEGREGKKAVVSLSISPVIVQGSEDPQGAIAVMRDISEERAEEKQRGEFISTASHEMRTPVAAIEGYLALALNDKVSTIDSRARGFLEKAHASTQHLGKLFQDLLTSSKAEDGRLSNHPSVVEMGAFMQQLTDDLRFSAEKKGLLAEFVIGGADETIDATTKDASVQHLVKPLYYVFVDPDRIREVVTNLFDNACKYTDSGKVSIGLTGNNEVVQLYVRDTGAGIPPDDITHLFQKFYRVDNSATRTIGGTGLGLFISRKIIELYQGRIWVESEIGKGSTFFINLPRLTTSRAIELQPSEASRTSASVPASPTARIS